MLAVCRSARAEERERALHGFACLNRLSASNSRLGEVSERHDDLEFVAHVLGYAKRSLEQISGIVESIENRPQPADYVHTHRSAPRIVELLIPFGADRDLGVRWLVAFA